jgi:hypothetical protein
MALTETAHLVAELDLKDNLSGAATAAEANVAGMDKAAVSAGASVGRLSGVAEKAGGAFTHFKGAVGGLLSGPLGFLGLGALVGGVGAAFTESIQKANDLGSETAKLSAITGDSAENLSAYVAVLDKYHISAQKAITMAGFAEKTLGTITATRKSALAFEKQYGIQVEDSKGKVVSFNTLLMEVADNYATNKNRAEAAALASKVFGKSYTDLIPLLSKGSQGIRDAEAAAKDLGLTLTTQNVSDLADYRHNMHDLNDAISGVELQLGLKLVPQISKVAKAVSDWLTTGGSKQLGTFFDGIVSGAEKVGSFVTGTLIPTIKTFASVAEGFWSRIPGPLKDLIVGGLVANKTVKFLFGIDLGGIAKDAIGGALKGLLGGIFQRGGPGNPMFVTVEGGLGGGLGGGAVGAAESAGGGIGSKLVSAVSILGAVAIAGTSIYLMAQQFGTFMQTNAQAQADLQAKADAAQQQTATDALSNLKNLNNKLGSLQGLDRILGDTFGGKQEADALQNLADSVTQNGHLTTAQLTDAISTLQAAQVQAQARGATTVSDHIGTDIATLQARLAAGNNAQTGLLSTIANQPTTVTVNTTTNVNATLSTRDTSATAHVASRYGMQAV